MSQLLPRKPPVEDADPDPQVVGLSDGDSADVFSVLSSEVARSILVDLYREPGPQSELADRADTSLQNVKYHLDKLVDAGLVEVVDQWYSEKGVEMDVYAPSAEPLVLVAGDGTALDDIDSATSESPTVEPAPTADD